jgi:hypothetical protein
LIYSESFSFWVKTVFAETKLEQKKKSLLYLSPALNQFNPKTFSTKSWTTLTLSLFFFNTSKILPQLCHSLTLINILKREKKKRSLYYYHKAIGILAVLRPNQERPNLYQGIQCPESIPYT